MKRALPILCLVVAACGEERPPIDRVQPLAFDKTFFVGADLQGAADDPEFWAQTTLVDVGFGAAQDGLFTSTYAQPVSRVRWQVTEDLLIARLAYEKISGTDGKGTGKRTQDGVIVAAYTIDKHFDIVNDYNSTTGEQVNVVVENDTDRPWYERRYMHVDFSKNLNTDSYDFDTLSMLGADGSVQYEPLAYAVNDPTDDQAPYFDLAHGYMDVTSKALAKPQTIDLSSFGWGISQFPACWLDYDTLGGTWPWGSCNPVELTLRTAFRKVEDHDYEPVDWDGYRFQAVGGFTVERSGFTRDYGMTDAQWHRFLSRYAIWERSHYYKDPAAMTDPEPCFTPGTTPFGADPHRDEDGDGTEDECKAVGQGSRCDTFRQRCTLPYGQRTPRPVVWYYSEGSNAEYFEPTDLAAHEWDVAMRVAVRTAQYAECQRVGGEGCVEKFPVYFGQEDENEDAVRLALEVDDCRNGRTHTELKKDAAACEGLADTLGAARGYDAGVVSIAKMPEMVVLCHSPVEANDSAVCAPAEARLPADMAAADCDLAKASKDEVKLAVCRAARNVRMGDLRYHHVNVIDKPQTESPWGIYADAEDPLTGEKVAASINTWSDINDYVARIVVDTMRYIGGELKTEDITEGKYVREWAQAAEAAASGKAPGMTQEVMERRLAEFAGHPEAAGKAPNAKMIEGARALLKDLKGVRASGTAASVMQPMYMARRQAAAGSAFEAALMTPAMQQLNGVAGAPMTPQLMSQVSPLQGGNPSLRRELRRLKRQALAERGACVLEAAQAPIATASLAKVFQEKFGAFDPTQDTATQHERAERMHRYLARRFQYGVIAHEMGHSIGMRHNFVSSSQAWGYRPQYWQLRTRDGTVKKECTELQVDGAACVGPRYFDPVTEEERNGLIQMFMQSTVMDYPGDATQDTMGLGAYDFAAAKLFYGDVVAVHADDTYKAGKPRGKGMLAITDNFGGILGYDYQVGDGNNARIHYSKLNASFELIKDCKPVNADDYRPARWDDAINGTWHAVFDGLVVSTNGQSTRCKQQRVDYVRWNDLRLPTTKEQGDVYFDGGPVYDKDGRSRLPYGFATDTWVDLGNLSVYTHDNGADAYELMSYFITQQEVAHIFEDYRRGRQEFSIRGASERTLGRYNEKMRDAAKGLTFIKNIYENFAQEIGYDFESGYWPYIAPYFFKDNILASGLAFDHFTRQLDRPEAGPHFQTEGDPVLRSSLDTPGNPGDTVVVVPNGATGYYGDVAFGGKPIENALAEDKGEYDTSFTMNVGSYYEKMYTSMLLTESVDNFISSSRSDFTDARYRATSMADLFPDGYRRWLGSNLTGDDELKGPRIAADKDGKPLVDKESYPEAAIGWTTWWSEEPQACFPADGTIACGSYGLVDNTTLGAKPPEHVAVLDPQVGWEQQKFLIAWTMLYLPENQKQTWIDQLRLWEMGVDADPQIANRIELHTPNGKVYVARTFGKETVFGKVVQKGVAARVLEYANQLLAEAYETTPVDIDGDHETDWVVPVLSERTGLPMVRWDPDIYAIDDLGNDATEGVDGCNANSNEKCHCSANRACMALQKYLSVPAYLRESIEAYQLGLPWMKGVWE